MPDAPLRLGSRTSRLAMWQAHHVSDLLRSAHPGLTVEIVPYVTKGDRTLDQPLPALGGKGVFTLELEDDLRSGRIDVAVHSLKDLPTDDPDGLTIGAIPRRGDPADAWVCPSGHTVETLPAGATVGTSSPRRASQVLRLRPDLLVRSIRGNVETRIAKAESDAYDATLLAVAGLERLGLSGRITQRLDDGRMVCAPGQAALGVQCRSGDDRVGGLLVPIDHAPTRASVTAERGLLAALGGGCSAPIGALATVRGGALALTARIVSLDGRQCVDVRVDGSAGDPHDAARRAAEQALARGARTLLDDARALPPSAPVAPRAAGPLAGRTVVVTRADGQQEPLATGLRNRGARVLEVPALAVEPAGDAHAIGAALRALGEGDWIGVTSGNGVRFGREHVRAAFGEVLPSGVRVAAVGTATSAALASEWGHPADWLPDDFTGDAFARDLPAAPGARVVLLRSTIARRATARVLEARGLQVDDLPVYATHERADAASVRHALEARPDAVTFTSPSAVRGWADGVSAAGLDRSALDGVALVPIGPTTADELRALDLPPALVPDPHTVDGLIDALVQWAHSEPAPHTLAP